jgi:5'-AMP-activated protein kinase regulatory beta subunit
MQTSLLQDYVPENLDSVAGFEPPRSPESSYNDPMPGPEEYAKEPPAVPPHLHLTLLNVPQVMETAGSLPRPQHVILNHLYVEKGKPSRTVLVLGTTNRFRSKYVTTVLYKPLMLWTYEG